MILFANIRMFVMAPMVDREPLYKDSLWTLMLMLLNAVGDEVLFTMFMMAPRVDIELLYKTRLWTLTLMLLNG